MLTHYSSLRQRTGRRLAADTVWFTAGTSSYSLAAISIRGVVPQSTITVCSFTHLHTHMRTHTHTHTHLYMHTVCVTAKIISCCLSSISIRSAALPNTKYRYMYSQFHARTRIYTHTHTVWVTSRTNSCDLAAISIEGGVPQKYNDSVHTILFSCYFD